MFDSISNADLSKFLMSASKAYRDAPSKGEDLRYWSNLANAERLEIAAKRLASPNESVLSSIEGFRMNVRFRKSLRGKMIMQLAFDGPTLLGGQVASDVRYIYWKDASEADAKELEHYLNPRII